MLTGVALRPPRVRGPHCGLALRTRDEQRVGERYRCDGALAAAGLNPRKSFASTNYHIQVTARDIFADVLLRLRAAGWGDALWLVIHDQIILQVPESWPTPPARPWKTPCRCRSWASRSPPRPRCSARAGATYPTPPFVGAQSRRLVGNRGPYRQSWRSTGASSIGLGRPCTLRQYRMSAAPIAR
jgi:hypothetical protein